MSIRQCTWQKMPNLRWIQHKYVVFIRNRIGFPAYFSWWNLGTHFIFDLHCSTYLIVSQSSKTLNILSCPHFFYWYYISSFLYSIQSPFRDYSGRYLLFRFCFCILLLHMYILFISIGIIVVSSYLFILFILFL